MKRWLILISLLAALAIAGFTVEYWFVPFMQFVGANSNQIQGLANLLQMVLWGAGGLVLLWKVFRRKKKIESQLAHPAEDHSVHFHKKAEGNIVHTGPGDVNIHPPPGKQANPKALREAYLNHLFESIRNLSLGGIDPKAASDAEQRLHLDAVYTALLTLTPEMHEKWLHGERLERESEQLSALEQLDRKQRLILLGDPGSGKSTFVNFVALCLTGEALGKSDANLKIMAAPIPQEDEEKKDKPQPWRHGPLLPVRVILRDFAARGLPEKGETATAKHLWEFIAKELKNCGLGDFAPHLRDALLKTGGLILLDGLDEVPEADARRTQIKQAVEDFAAVYGKCRLLVTSRTYAYQKQDWRLRNFEETILAPFTKPQIRLFVTRWYGHIGPMRGLSEEEYTGRVTLLQRAIDSREQLFALAQRPLLLTLMASLHAWRGGSLPEKREELYNDTVDLLLDWWEQPKIVRDRQGKATVLQPSLAEWLKVDRRKVRELLNKLAFQAHKSQPDLTGAADIAEGDLVSGLMHLNPQVKINPAELLDYLSQRAGLLLPRGAGVFTFPHLTFQEYLTACHLTDDDFPEKLAALTCEEPNRWREVALLAAAKAARGVASSVWQLAEELCFKALPGNEKNAKMQWGAHIAGQVLVETANLANISERNRPKLTRVKTWLVHNLADNDFPARERALTGVTQ